MMHPRDGHPKVLAMLSAYLDESGIHGGKDVGKLCVIAGYFGQEKPWKHFERDWRKALSNHLVPLEKFHAKDLIKRRGFFMNFSKRAYLALIHDLLKAITAYEIFPIISAVLISDFFHFSLNQRKFLTGAKIKNGRFVTTGCPTKPYFLPFQNCLGMVSDYTPSGNKMHFFFGLDRTFSEHATDLFREIKLTDGLPYRDKLGDPAFPLAKETPQLQAADYLSYAVYLDMQERFGQWEKKAPPELRVAISKGKSKHDFKYLDENTMNGLMEGISIPV